MKKSKIKSVVIKSLGCMCLMGFFTLFSVLLCEVVLRVSYPQEPTFRIENKYTVSQCINNWKGTIKTGEFQTTLEFNNLGLRGEEIPYNKPLDSTRILFLGDSFVEAPQVNLNAQDRKSVV